MERVMRMIAGEDPEPTEEHEGLPLKIQLVLVVTAVTFVTILFEKSKEYLMDAASGEMHKVLESVFSELTVMGFIGLVIFTTDKADLLDEDATALVERVHMIVFAIAVIFLVQICMLMGFSKSMSKHWHSTEHILHGDEVKGRMLLINDYAVAQAKFKAGGLLSWLSWNKRNALKNARFNLEYHGIRDAFIAYQQHGLTGLHHSAVSYDHDRLKRTFEDQPQLVREFHMAEYLHHLMTDMFAEFVEIPPTTWITIYVFFTLFWLIVELTNDLVLLCAFLTVPYWLLLLLTKVIWKERRIRKALVPDIMYNAAEALEMMNGAEDDQAVDEMMPMLKIFLQSGSSKALDYGTNSAGAGSLRQSNPRGAVQLAPVSDSDSDSDSDEGETVTLIPRRISSQSTQASEQEQQPTAMPKRAINRSSFSARSAFVPIDDILKGSPGQAAAGSINDDPDRVEMASPGGHGCYKTFVVPGADNRSITMMETAFTYLNDVLELHQTRDDFAAISSIPFLRERKHTVDGENGSFAMCALPQSMADWLAGVHHGHGDENPLNEHERLFWFGRRGPDYLMYLIRLGMVCNAVFLSVMATHWMPRIWTAELVTSDFKIDDDSVLGGIKGFQVVVTLVAFLPSIVVGFRLYRALELYVIVSYAGLNRIPEVMLKVIRNAKTRKSLSVLKLLSSVKSAMKRGGAGTPGPSHGPNGQKTHDHIVGLNPPHLLVPISDDTDSDDGRTGDGMGPSHSNMHNVAAHTFTLLDEDNSGSIDYEEFDSLLDKLGIGHTKQELDTIWNELDEDGSGLIDRDEFLGWVDTLESSGATDLSSNDAIDEFVEHIFAAIDTDGDGVVTASELFHCLDRLGQGVTFEDVQTIMADVDEDGSGGVDKEEFTELIRKNADYI